MPHQPSKPEERIKFISVSLTVELRKELHDFAEDCCSDDILRYIHSAYLDGYRLGIKSEDIGCSAALVARENGQSKANMGYMLMERASTPERALKRLFWAHEVVYEKKWPKNGQTTDDDW